MVADGAMGVAVDGAAAARPGVDALSPRHAFTRYVRAVLSSTLAGTELRTAGVPCSVVAFTLRDGRHDRSPIDIGPPDDRDEALLKPHLDALLDVTAPDFLRKSAEWTCAWRFDLRTVSRFHTTGCSDEDFAFAYPIPAAEPSATDACTAGSEGSSSGGSSRGIDGEADYIACLLGIVLDVVDLLGSDGAEVVPSEAVHAGQTALIPCPHPVQALSLGPRVQGREGSGQRQPLQSVGATEPAIAALGRHWGLLVAAARFGDLAGPLDVVGFRLLHAADWVVPSTGHPAEVYEYLARICNVSCKFCYLYGNPSTMAIARGNKVVSRDEITTRLRYFDPTRKRALFRAQWEINEFLVDPKLPDVLRSLRQQTAEPFFFVTNGSPLTPRVVDLLAEVQPVQLIVSINSIDENLRADVMHETQRQTLTAMACFELLAERRIPFGISLAAFPEFPIPLLDRTIRAVEPCRPAFVRVNLPGYTASLPYAADEDLDEHWIRVVEWVRSVRREVSTPIITIPSAFEEGSFHADANAPRVLGIVPNSPAQTSGLRPGDVVRRIGAFDVETRADAAAVLLMLRKPTVITIDRGRHLAECTLTPATPTDYPYRSHQAGKYIFPHGIVMAPSLARKHMAQVREHLADTGARRAWILTSPLMRPAAEQIITAELGDRADDIELICAHNHYLGGNIRVMDMCTIGDLARALAERLADAPSPDAVLVPGSGFNFQGRDIAGRHWGDLERWFGIPMRLIDIDQFLF